MQVRLCDSSQDAVKTEASPSATCAIVTSESLAEINANFFSDDDKPGLPIRMENPDPDHHPRLPQSHANLELPEPPFSQGNHSNHRPSPDLPTIHSPPQSAHVNPENMLHVPVIRIASTGLQVNRSIFTGTSAMPQCKSSLASLVSAASISLKHEQELANEDTAAAAILLFKGETSEAANLILGLPLTDPHGTEPIAFVCTEDELASAGSGSKCPSPFPAHVVDAMDPSSGSLEYDSNPPPSSTGSNNSSATDVVGVSVALTGTLSSSAAATATGRRAGNGGASAGGNGPDLPDTKEGIEELCPVCGDKVSGYHYGLLTCESCKGFFKRTVQNKKVYTCVADRSCHIDKSQRKRCPFCRFQKCLEVGMKLEAVRADRMRGGRNKFGPMYKRDRARKLQTIREKQMRPSASGTPSSQSSSGGTPSQTAMYATDATLYTVGGPASTGNNPLPLYVTGGGIKHEIQIPQVSSLTSSPDSSPSPLGIPGASYANHGTSNHGGMGGASNGGQTHEKQLWNNNNNSNNPGSGTNVPSNHTTTPSPPHPQHPHLSPKQFQFEGLLGSSVGTSASGNIGAGLTGTGTGTGTGTTPTAKMPPLVREFVQSLDDKEWQSALFGLLQSQSYNQVEVDLFELLCKVLDQNLFSQVDWARNSVFFKDLRVDDQMKMLQHSWSDLLILDHIHQRLHNHLPDDTTLPNGQKFELVSLAMLGASELAEPLHDLTRRLQEIRFDVPDYICLKFLLLLNPDVRGLLNRRHVVEAHDQVQQALFDYTLNCYPQVPDKFSKLLAILPDVHSISSRGEDFLYFKHLNGFAPTQTLLMEMLHAKRR